MLFWAYSVTWVRNRHLSERLTWSRVPLSFFGLIWLGFGVTFIVRFLALVYDPEYFCATNLPLWYLPPETFSKIWLSLAAFWIAFCAAFVAAMSWLPKNPPQKFILIEDIVSLANINILDIIAISSSMLIIVLNTVSVPISLLTPLGRIAFLYLIPIIIAWFLYFEGRKIGVRRFTYLIPGIITYFFNPYREVMLTILLCVLLPALQLQRIRSWYKLALLMILFLLTATQINDTYRSYEWGGNELYRQEKTETRWEYWQREPQASPWVKLSNRFHGFDSTALTVFAVPDTFPYSNRFLLSELAIRALFPRMILDTKSEIQRGRKFSTTIWSLNERGGTVKRDSAMIAPSLPGDLYSVHGLPIVILGALCFGFLVGLLESWARGSAPGTRCLLLVLFGVSCVGAIERDFTNGLANIIQQVIVLFFVLFVAQAIISHKKSVPSKTRLAKLIK